MLLTLALLLTFQDPPAFQTGVALVHVDVAATVNGRPVNGLAAADFLVTDNGTPQQIFNFGQQEQPLDVVLLLDVSASMEGAMARVAETASHALSELRAGDRVALLVFSDKTHVRENFTTDFTVIERALPELLGMKFVYETRLQKAIDDAALLFLHESDNGRRRAVLMITDNLGNDFEEHALEHMWQADAVLSGLIVTRAGQSVATAFARVGGMTAIAEKTGGDTLNATETGGGFRDLMRRLRLRYGFDYRMPQLEPGEMREIRVELIGEQARRLPDAMIRARSGYIAPR